MVQVNLTPLRWPSQSTQRLVTGRYWLLEPAPATPSMLAQRDVCTGGHPPPPPLFHNVTCNRDAVTENANGCCVYAVNAAAAVTAQGVHWYTDNIQYVKLQERALPESLYYTGCSMQREMC